jgi:hypothetical protein
MTPDGGVLVLIVLGVAAEAVLLATWAVERWHRRLRATPTDPCRPGCHCRGRG